MVVKRSLVAVVLVLLVACGSDTETPQSANDGADPSSGLTTDYEFEPYPGSQWYGPNGQEIPKESNVINAITGPEHCDWQAGVMMHVGWPLGRDAENISQSRQYFRDPEKVFPQESFMTTYDGDTELPDSAENTGYRTDFMELWLDSNDDTAAYLVFADHVERWPRTNDVIACA